MCVAGCVCSLRAVLGFVAECLSGRIGGMGWKQAADQKASRKGGGKNSNWSLYELKRGPARESEVDRPWRQAMVRGDIRIIR